MAAEGAHRAQFQIVPTEEIGDAPMIYANFVQGTVTPFDLTFHFGWYAIPPLTEPPSQPVQVPVRQVAKVSVPLSLVPGIVQMMQKQLEAWQDAFGQEPPTEPSQPEPSQHEKSEASQAWPDSR